jgi:prepilin-type N-terminal cleavage/methylation domain-containing protein
MGRRLVLVRRNRQGFTLIEVLGAMVIFSVGVLMIMSMTTSLSSRFRSNTLRTNIAIVGQVRLDSIAALQYDSVAVGSAVDTLTISNETYTCTMTITQTDPVSRTVQVSLDPLDGTGPRFDGTVYVVRVW